MASPGRDVKLSEQRVKGYRNFLTKIWNANNFLKVNKCGFKNQINPKKFLLNINKWIYSELISTKNLAEKHIKGYRFDEASRVIYKFVWNSYCDWYLELSKTILFSKNKKHITEVKNTSGFVFKEILILLHPFIPFITEELWLKNKLGSQKNKYLMYAPWIKDKKIQKDKETTNVNQVIDAISKIRSFKNELNVSPGSFIDISIQNVSKEKQNLFLKNEIVLKKLGRINSIFTKDSKNESVSLVISGEIFKIYFDKNVDLNLIKDNLVKKQDKLSKELGNVGKKLDNKSFIERAPNHIVEQEKNTYNELKNDIDKINLTIKSLT
jgi:valyl-tRNA synthetase